MFLRADDLFEGMGQEFINELENLAVKESYEVGAFVYRRGDAAGHFYTLLEGMVRLSYGTESRVTFSLSRSGDTFGLSSLVKRSAYAGSAQCETAATVRKVEMVKLERLFQKQPTWGLIFWRRLAGVVFQRMLDSYNSLLGAYKGAGPPSYG
jgi:CRP-like cAMP-binding protein